MNEKNSKYLTGQEMPSYLKKEIFCHSLQLILYNALLIGRPDKHYYILSCIGVLFSLIPLAFRKKYYMITILSFTFLLQDHPAFFYILYGYVVTSTYQTVSILFLSLSQRCTSFLRKIEILCMVFPCFIPVHYNYLIFGCICLTFINTYLLVTPPVEIRCKNDDEVKKCIFPAIQKMINEEDYVLIAKEQREIVGYHIGRKIQRKKSLKNYIDLLIPVMLLNLKIMMKSWIFVSIIIPFPRFYYLNFLFFFFLILEMKDLLVVAAPFCDWDFAACTDSWGVTWAVLSRVAIGYIAYLISIAYLE